VNRSSPSANPFTRFQHYHFMSEHLQLPGCNQAAVACADDDNSPFPLRRDIQRGDIEEAGVYVSYKDKTDVAIAAECDFLDDTLSAGNVSKRNSQLTLERWASWKLSANAKLNFGPNN